MHYKGGADVTELSSACLQAKGMTYNKGSYISGDTEEEAADELRMAVHDALCRDQSRAKTFSEVDYSVEKFDGGKAK